MMTPVVPSNNSESNLLLFNSNNNQKKFVLFRIGNCKFAAIATEICEVLIMPKLLPLAKAKDDNNILGVVNLRGNVIPIVNLHLRFNQYYSNSTQQKLIIVNIDQQYIGFPVDHVETKLSNGSVESDEHSITGKSVTCSNENKFYLLEPRQIFKIDERTYLKALIQDFSV